MILNSYNSLNLFLESIQFHSNFSALKQNPYILIHCHVVTDNCKV